MFHMQHALRVETRQALRDIPPRRRPRMLGCLETNHTKLLEPLQDRLDGDPVRLCDGRPLERRELKLERAQPGAGDGGKHALGREPGRERPGVVGVRDGKHKGSEGHARGEVQVRPYGSYEFCGYLREVGGGGAGKKGREKKFALFFGAQKKEEKDFVEMEKYDSPGSCARSCTGLRLSPISRYLRLGPTDLRRSPVRSTSLYDPYGI